MTIDKLIEQYEWAKRKKREYDFSQHITMRYMPYAEKESLVKNVINSTSYVEVAGRKVYKRSTTAMLFVFTMQLIAHYTDLEFTNEEVVTVYDALMESGVMNQLMTQIPEEEINILRGMLDMQRDDEEVNTRSLISFFESKTEALQLAMESLGKVLEKPEIQEKIVEFTK